AAKEFPDDLSFRTALKNHKDMVINRLLAAADADQAAGRDMAQATYERVLRLDTRNASAINGIQAIARSKQHTLLINDAKAMLKQGNTEGAKEALRQVLAENPDNQGAKELQRQINDQATRVLLAEPALMTKFKKPINLQFRDANLKMVFEALARTSGINILLDKDVRPDLKTSLFVKDVSVEDTIDLILLQNQLEKKVLSENSVFIYPNTPAKQKDFQDLKIRSFHLVNADAKQMLTMIKTILKTKDIFVHEKTNSIVIRDTPDAIRLAEKLIADQDGAEPEVMLEVEVLEVTRSSLTNIGIQFPDQLVLTASGLATGSTGTSSALTLNQLKNINSDRILTSPPLAVGFNLHMDHGDVNILASPRIRVRNKEKAKIMIGDRVPVITNAVTPVATGAPVVTGNVQYLDVGLKVDVEPTINSDNEVAIKVSLDVSSIAKEVPNTVSGTLAYQIGTRNATTALRLKDGETQVLAGLINDQDTHTANEVPILGQIPILGRLFSSHKNDASKSEIVLSITPHIVRPARLPEASEVEYWSGTEATIRGSPVTLKPIGNIALSSSTVPVSGVAQRTTTPPTKTTASPARPFPAPPSNTPSTSGASQTADPMSLSWTGPNQAKVGDRISLTLSSASPQAVGSLGFLVNYDANVLRVLDAKEGNLLRKGDPSSVFKKELQQESGQVVVDLSSQAKNVNLASGTVVTLAFEVLAGSPQTQITVSRITTAGPSGDTVPVTGPEPFSITLAQ
ncbi:MAG TPA: cohesin domain-containing protein, partial [Rhodocyclaceae bacterium]|nr:cohesin domain-containing protein [Rhodocyclaceae bacterium]